MKKTILSLLLFSFALFPLFCDNGSCESPQKYYINLDVMLVVKVGAEYNFTPEWGIKGGIGISPFSPSVFGYELLGVRHLRPGIRDFQWDLEFGLPLAYFDFLEGNVINWDPIIDGPYAGWGPGVDLFWGWPFLKKGYLGFKTGAVLVNEIQRNTGWGDPKVLPYVSVQWIF